MHIGGGKADAANDTVTHDIQTDDGEEGKGQKPD